MANLTESATYDAGVYQIETVDPVSGGPTGIANKPLINLANRTKYLKGRVDLLEAGTTIPPGVATLASPTFTGDPKAPTQALGDNDTSIATTAFVQGTMSGRLAKSVAGGVNVTLTAAEAGYGILEFSGALTANISVIVPGAPTKSWIVKNATSGAFTLTVKTAAGAGVVCVQGRNQPVWTDGTNVYASQTAFDSPAMTGVPTATTAGVGTNTTQVATTEFVQAEIAADAAPIAHVGATGAAHGAATTAVAGFMSAADKTKLDGVAAGAQVNAVTSVAGRTGAVTIAVGDVSGAAPLASPTFTGVPAAPTATAGTNTTQVATTAFVTTAVAGVSIPFEGTAANIKMDGTQSVGTLATAARGDHVHPTDTSRAPLASPTFTGVPAAPTAAAGNSTTQLATTAFVNAEINNDRPYEGTDTNIKMNGTQAVGALATVARGDHVHPTDTTRAPLASPTFTGVPAAPTATAGTNTTQLATTEFVASAVSTASGSAVQKDSATGAAALPSGTTAQRPAAGAGKLRYNSDLGRFEGSTGAAWGSLGGAVGGGTDSVFYENDQSVTSNYTITSGRNAMSAGPIAIVAGVTVTVPAGSTWVIV